MPLSFSILIVAYGKADYASYGSPVHVWKKGEERKKKSMKRLEHRILIKNVSTCWLHLFFSFLLQAGMREFQSQIDGELVSMAISGGDFSCSATMARHWLSF